MMEKWNCQECESLLGKRYGNEMEIRYKKIQYSIGGENLKIVTSCRKCGRLNRISIHGDTIEEMSKL